MLRFFAQERFSSFWYSSGTPKFLIDLIKKRPEGYINLSNPVIGELELDNFDISRLELEPLLFQAGYLTVKEVLYETVMPIYALGIPNSEVREAFNLHILAELTESGGAYARSACRRIHESLSTGDLEGMLLVMRGLFASIPYQLHISHESYYHSIVYALISALGFYMDAEVSVSGGRIDAVLEFGDKVYVIEFKYESCNPDATPEQKQKLSEKALDSGVKQIRDKGYADKYAGSGKAIYHVAFVFLGRDNIEMRVES